MAGYIDLKTGSTLALWRKLVGVEPTCDTKVPHDGFEARAGHRPRLASSPILTDDCAGSSVNATLESLVPFSPVV